MKLYRGLLTKPTSKKRAIFFIISDGIIFTISLFLSFTIKYGFELDVPELPEFYFLKAVILFSVIKFFVFAKFRLYQFTWKYVGLNDLFNLLKANTVSLFIIAFLFFIGSDSFLDWLPKSVIAGEYFISFILSGFLRISKRLYIEIFNPMLGRTGKTTLIIGADSSGEMILRDIRKTIYKNYNVIGFLDDDESKQGFYIHDIPVIGTLDSLERLISRYQVEALIIADDKLSLKETQELYTTARKIGINDIKIVPRLYAQTDVEITVKKLEDIRVEDLINRQEIQVEIEKMQEFLSGKNVLITGAAGSIGSEIVRQVCLFNPNKVLLFEIDETEIFFLEKQLHESFPEIIGRIIPVIGDVRDRTKIRQIFAKYKPDIVFHSAAYKHVPLMESNPEEAIKVNNLGVFYLCEAAIEFGVSKFINISTDKAVKPASVMGASKRFSEYIANAFNGLDGTQFISVRFGNVLGSRGSVVPIFLEQLRKGGPITITDPEMKRYFMTIPEAVTLVLQAGFMGRGGEIMVLDMGEPIYIKSLAEELIRLHGLDPGKDIEIIYTGIRPGEKIFEEILTAEEGTTKTTNDRIYTANVSKHFTHEEVIQELNSLEKILANGLDSEKLKTALLSIINRFSKKD